MLFNVLSFALLLSLLSSVETRSLAPHHATRHWNSSLPIVDLGYERHQAIAFHETGGYYNFSNIRYGAAPVGELRFRAPVEPPTIQSGGSPAPLTNGSVGRVCPQASGNWTVISQAFAQNYTTGQPFDYDLAESKLPPVGLPISADPRTTEDCLFLDVMAPRKSMEKGKSLPVLVHIFGGGYTSGEKTGYGSFDPTGLMNMFEEGFVFVALNYRLGAFGWLGGEDVAQDGDLNAGLYDQRLALQWVQKYIHLFGGDKDRVTVMGSSAGAGSIMHHITSPLSYTSPLFNRAILLSPAFYPSPYPPSSLTSPSAEAYSQLLRLTNATSLSQLRALPSPALIAANAALIYHHAAPYGSNLFGPLVDGSYVPALPGETLLLHDDGGVVVGKAENGKHGAAARPPPQNLQIMTMHNTAEGVLFTDPRVDTGAEYKAQLRASFPDISDEAVRHVDEVLYPAIFDGETELGYDDQLGRAVATTGDVNVVCNTRYLDWAMRGEARGLQFAVPPGLHGDQVPYVFYNPASSSQDESSVDAATAMVLQGYIVKYVSGESADQLPVVYGDESKVTRLGPNGTTEVIMDDAANERCAWWQEARYA